MIVARLLYARFSRCRGRRDSSKRKKTGCNDFLKKVQSIVVGVFRCLTITLRTFGGPHKRCLVGGTPFAKRRMMSCPQLAESERRPSSAAAPTGPKPYNIFEDLEVFAHFEHYRSESYAQAIHLMSSQTSLLSDSRQSYASCATTLKELSLSAPSSPKGVHSVEKSSTLPSTSSNVASFASPKKSSSLSLSSFFRKISPRFHKNRKSKSKPWIVVEFSQKDIEGQGLDHESMADSDQSLELALQGKEQYMASHTGSTTGRLSFSGSGSQSSLNAWVRAGKPKAFGPLHHDAQRLLEKNCGNVIAKARGCRSQEWLHSSRLPSKPSKTPARPNQWPASSCASSRHSIGSLMPTVVVNSPGTVPMVLLETGYSEQESTIEQSFAIPHSLSAGTVLLTGIPEKRALDSNVTQLSNGCWNIGGSTVESLTTKVPEHRPSYLGISCAINGYTNYSQFCRSRDSSPARLSPRTAAPHSTSPGNHLKVEPILEIKASNGRGELTNGRRHHGPQEFSAAPEPWVTVVHSKKTSWKNLGIRQVVNGGGAQKLNGNHAAGVDEVDKALDLPVEMAPTQHVSSLLSPVCTKALSSSDLPVREGHTFLATLSSTQEVLECHIREAERDLKEATLSEDMKGRIRAAIGKANLLINKKFKQFKELCLKNIDQNVDDPFPTTGSDLAGFWDMVMLQVDNVQALFEELNVLKANNWVEPAKTEIQGDPEKAEEAAKSRLEARKRLMEAKRQARQQQQSQPAATPNEDIAIFVPQEKTN
ncbi:hypothetical protein MRX96_037326 [Rhipicephalus microplus]